MNNFFRPILPAGLMILASVAVAQNPVTMVGTGYVNDGEVHVLPVRGNVFMLVGAGGNIALSVGSEGVLMVDAGDGRMSDKILAAVNQTAREVETKGLPMPGVAPTKPIRIIIDTSDDPDHVGGNAALMKAGRDFTGGNATGALASLTETAQVYAQENVLLRMSGKPAPGKAAIPFELLPTDTYTADQMYLSHFFNGEGVLLLHQKNAHTDGDTMVWFRGSDVIATGDIFRTTAYPDIDLARGGHIQGEIDALNKILDLAVPEFRLEGGTMIIPGHGRLCDSADLAYYRDMVTIIRDRVQDAIKRGLTLQQTKDAGLTKDYDRRYGSSDKFVEAIYRDLTANKQVSSK
jgi:glyoxylase-like metal-dependent hydrolase (beta-lactamase superfamily II)